HMTAYGHLTVICGPMYAGKTTETLKRVLWTRNGQGKTVRVLKPAFDDRYGVTEIVSHDGLRTQAESITELPMDTEGTDLIVLDEVQFFPNHVAGNLVDWIRDHLARGTNVVAAGLDMDYRGSPFAATAALLGMADEVLKINANCTVCGKPARKTFKKSGNLDSDDLELGSSDKYEARCNQHW
ncbi:MAG: thymidine kinase, partial [Oxalobacteraceae bacterium]